MASQQQKLRYAIVGLGDIVQEAVLPSFEHCDHSTATAFVSSDERKLHELGERYGVKHLYTYERFDECLKSGNVDAVYVGLPNHLHRDYTVRAADARKHVLCEKPMAVSAIECLDMIDAAKRSGVKLMIAYRLHFEEGNLEAIHTGQSGAIGDLRYFTSSFSQQVKEGNVRITHPPAEGGGPVFDMGVYCINAARYLFQDEPLEISAITASSNDPRFAQAEEMTSVVMKFPHERLGSFTVSFGAEAIDEYALAGTKGVLQLQPAYGYVDEIKHKLSFGDEKKERAFERRDQFAAEIDYFSLCVANNHDPEPDGQEGLIDVMIVQAIYESARSEKPVRVALPHKMRRPNLQQSIHKPPVARKPELVDASSPSKD